MPNTKIISIRDQIADQIRSDVISGKLPPKTKLSEQALANRFGVSRGPVRDVLLQLTKEGLLVSKSNCGVSVNNALTPELQKLMIDIRLRIETFAIHSLIGTLDNDDYQALDSILNKIPPAFEDQDFTLVTKTDIEFHRYIIERAGGDELCNLWYPIVIRMRMNYKRVNTADNCIQEHRAILKSLKENDIETTISALEANIK